MAPQTADKDQPTRAFDHIYPVHLQSLAIPPPRPFTPPVQSPWRPMPSQASLPAHHVSPSKVQWLWVAPCLHRGMVHPTKGHPSARFFHFCAVLLLPYPVKPVYLSLTLSRCPFSVPLCSKQCRRHTKRDYEPTVQYREYIEDLELQYVDYLTYSFPSLASCSGLFAPLHTSIVVSLSLVSVCPFISVSLMSLALAPLLAPLPPLQPRPAHGRWAGQWPRWTACQKGIVSSDLPK